MSVAGPAVLDVKGPVQAEVLVLSLAPDGIALGGPCGPDPWYVHVNADEDPLAVVAAMVTSNLAEPLVVHSTSWRRHRDAVVLTFVAVVDPETAGSRQVRPVRRVSLARGEALAAPTDVAVDQVVEHSLRHLAWLVADDPIVADCLGPSWAEALASYHLEPFRALGERGGSNAARSAVRLRLADSRQRG